MSYVLHLMSRPMKIYTRTGDKGKTGLFGGDRINKSAARLHAYGTIDELNACLGLVLSEFSLPMPLEAHLHTIQQRLFEIGADLATPLVSKAKIIRMDERIAVELEEWIDLLEKDLPALTAFILPSGSRVGALLHQARTVCRRAERWIVSLSEEEKVNQAIIIIINRLSDYLFVASRYANKALGMPEQTVEIPKKTL